MVVYFISSQLLENFWQNETRNTTPEERSISHRLFRTIQWWIENEFLDSLDVAIEGQLYENELTSAAEELEFECEEPPRRNSQEKKFH